MSYPQSVIEEWFRSRNRQPFEWQTEVWHSVLEGNSGLLNAPTGSGKTFALFMPVLMRWMDDYPDDYQSRTRNGLRLPNPPPG